MSWQLRTCTCACSGRNAAAGSLRRRVQQLTSQQQWQACQHNHLPLQLHDKATVQQHFGKKCHNTMPAPNTCCLGTQQCDGITTVHFVAAGFLLYSIVALALIIYLIFWVAPEHGTENVLVYLAICSLAGSFTVTSCKVCCPVLC